MEKFKHDFQQHIKRLQQKYSEFMERHGVPSLLIHSGRAHVHFLDDNDYPYRANPHFVYFAPLVNHPHCFLFLEPGKKVQLFYFVSDDFWFKPPAPPEGFWVDEFDIHLIRNTDEVKDILGERLKETVYLGEYGNEFASWGITKFNEKKIVDEINYLRTQKSAYEVACLYEASIKAIPAHVHAEALFRKGDVSELEIHLEFLKKVQTPEWLQPYTNIVAFNEGSAVLHYIDYQATSYAPSKLRSLLIDAGATCNGYGSDITRTYSYAKGPFTELIDAVEGLKHRIINELRLGQFYFENNRKTHRYFAEILLNFGIIKGLSVDAIVEKKVSNIFFPHGLGHLLGIQVHDIGGHLKNGQGEEYSAPADYPTVRLTAALIPGHVFTVEPGLYFIDPLLKKLKESPESVHANWEKIESFRPFGGIRTEDNVAIVGDKIMNLTQDAINFVGMNGKWR